jgi:hypothetical protein
MEAKQLFGLEAEHVSAAERLPWPVVCIRKVNGPYFGETKLFEILLANYPF